MLYLNVGVRGVNLYIGVNFFNIVTKEIKARFEAGLWSKRRKFLLTPFVLTMSSLNLLSGYIIP